MSDPWVDPLEKGMATHSSYSCLENSMHREPRWATVHGVAELDTTELITHTHTYGKHDSLSGHQ